MSWRTTKRNTYFASGHWGCFCFPIATNVVFTATSVKSAKDSFWSNPGVMLINALVVEAQGFHLLKKVLLNCCQLAVFRAWNQGQTLRRRSSHPGVTGDEIPILGSFSESLSLASPLRLSRCHPDHRFLGLRSFSILPRRSIGFCCGWLASWLVLGRVAHRFEYRMSDFWKSVL